MTKPRSISRTFHPKPKRVMNHVVKFCEAEISAVKIDREVFVALKPICEAIGLDTNYAIERLKSDEILGELYGLNRVVAADGSERMMGCLPLDFIPGWLFSIETSRVKEEARPALLVFKRKCYQVLRDYFFGNPSEAAERFFRIGALKRERKALKKRIGEIDAEIRLLERVQMQLPFNRTQTQNQNQSA